MEAADVTCPVCETRFQVPEGRQRVTCPRCGTAYDVRLLVGDGRFGKESHSATIGDRAPLAIVESRLAELDELVDEVRSEIEALRSRELSEPLRIGCSFFGLFFAVTLVLAAFMLLGKSYVGGWLFYLFLAAVIAGGLARIRQKLRTRTPPARLRQERLALEETLSELQSERDRIHALKADLGSADP